MKYNIEKNEKMLKEMAPDKFQGILLLIGLLGNALCIDLEKILNIKLSTIGSVLGTMALMEIGLCIAWFIHSTIHILIKKQKNKIQNTNKENEK